MFFDPAVERTVHIERLSGGGKWLPRTLTVFADGTVALCKQKSQSSQQRQQQQQHGHQEERKKYGGTGDTTVTGSSSHLAIVCRVFHVRSITHLVHAPLYGCRAACQLIKVEGEHDLFYSVLTTAANSRGGDDGGRGQEQGPNETGGGGSFYSRSREEEQQRSERGGLAAGGGGGEDNAAAPCSAEYRASPHSTEPYSLVELFNSLREKQGGLPLHVIEHYSANQLRAAADVLRPLQYVKPTYSGGGSSAGGTALPGVRAQVYVPLTFDRFAVPLLEYERHLPPTGTDNHHRHQPQIDNRSESHLSSHKPSADTGTSTLLNLFSALQRDPCPVDIKVDGSFVSLIQRAMLEHPMAASRAPLLRVDIPSPFASTPLVVSDLFFASFCAAYDNALPLSVRLITHLPQPTLCRVSIACWEYLCHILQVSRPPAMQDEHTLLTTDYVEARVVDDTGSGSGTAAKEENRGGGEEGQVATGAAGLPPKLKTPMVLYCTLAEWNDAVCAWEAVVRCRLEAGGSELPTGSAAGRDSQPQPSTMMSSTGTPASGGGGAARFWKTFVTELEVAKTGSSL